MRPSRFYFRARSQVRLCSAILAIFVLRVVAPAGRVFAVSPSSVFHAASLIKAQFVSAIAETKPAANTAPEVSAIDPRLAARGSQLPLKITGKHFAAGLKVGFGNPSIHVTEVRVASPSEVVAQIEVAPDAATGTTTLFVINPDDREGSGIRGDRRQQ